MSAHHIFIGSSKENQRLAEKIAHVLAESNYKPRRWWDSTEFPSGCIVIDRLKDIASEVDGAVFIFGEDDITWVRGCEQYKTRDNVVLETGMFVSKLGRELVVTVKDEEVDLPSDFNAVTYQKAFKDETTTAEFIRDKFDDIFKSTNVQSIVEIPLAADPDLATIMLNKRPPKDWHTRFLYAGIEGAKGWLECIGDQGYEPEPVGIKIRNLINSVLKGLTIRTFISLGPGDGRLDKEIVQNLCEGNRRLNYIPIDISEGLLFHSYKSISPRVNIPICILTDFEDNLPFVSKIITRYGSGARIFSCLGNTLGNLDKYEKCYLHELKSCMRKDDYLLIELSIYGKDWNRELDPRNTIQSSENGPSKFLARGISKFTGEGVKEILDHLEKRLSFEVGYSEIPDAKVIKISYDKSQYHITSVTRYNFESVKKWLLSEFKFELVAEEYDFYDNESSDIEMLGTGVLLLKI